MPTLSDLLRADGAKATPGIKTIGYYALVADILTWPAFAGTATAAETVTIEDDIVFNTGKKFFKIYSTKGLGKFTSKKEGVRDSKGNQNQVMFSHPGSTPALVGSMEIMTNSSIIVIVPDQNGNFRILGSPDDPAQLVSAEEDSGDEYNTFNGMKITFESTGAPAPFYTGVISTTPAS
jgi:hypothetical protein